MSQPRPDGVALAVKPTLDELLEDVAAGDRRAFRLVYERTSAKLLASAVRILGTRGRAEDAVQEAYVRIWHRAGDFDPAIASPIAWMTTIARHAAIDIARRGAERVSAASVAADDDFVARLASPGSPEDPLERDRLRRCLDGLAAHARSMVVLAYCEGWSREELAARFDRPAATVKTVLRRSLIRLKECLGGSSDRT